MEFDTNEIGDCSKLRPVLLSVLPLPYIPVMCLCTILCICVYLHADATQPATGHLALPVLSLPFPVSPMSRC